MHSMHSIAIDSLSSNQKLHTSQNNSNKMCFRKKPYQCSLCDKSFSTEIVLSEHEETHKGGIFSCYCCGEVASTLTKMVAHMKIHFIDAQTLSLVEVDSFLDVSYELIEIEPISTEVDDVMLVESTTNQIPKKENFNELIGNECKKEFTNDITHKIMNTQVEKEGTESLNKTVENEFSIRNNSETMKGKKCTVKSISKINKNKGTIKNKRMVKKLNVKDNFLGKNEHTDTEHTTKNIKGISICKNYQNQESIIDDIINERAGQYSKNEKNGPIIKKEASTDIEVANKNNNTSNFDICQILSKQELKSISDIEVSLVNTDQKIRKVKKKKLNSTEIDIVKFKCDQCDFESKYKSNLCAHKKRHCLKKFIKCQYCKFKSKYKGSMNKHIERHMLNKCKANEGNNNEHQKYNIDKNKKNEEKNKRKKMCTQI